MFTRDKYHRFPVEWISSFLACFFSPYSLKWSQFHAPNFPPLRPHWLAQSVWFCVIISPSWSLIPHECYGKGRREEGGLFLIPVRLFASTFATAFLLSSCLAPKRPHYYLLRRGSYNVHWNVSTWLAESSRTFTQQLSQLFLSFLCVRWVIPRLFRSRFMDTLGTTPAPPILLLNPHIVMSSVECPNSSNSLREVSFAFHTNLNHCLNHHLFIWHNWKISLLSFLPKVSAEFRLSAVRPLIYHQTIHLIQQLLRRTVRITNPCLYSS